MGRRTGKKGFKKLDNPSEGKNEGKGQTNQGKEETARKQKKPKKGTGKEKADDVPPWAKGNKP